jgi:hypothetical protein
MPELNSQWSLQVKASLDKVIHGIFTDPVHAKVRLDDLIEEYNEDVREAEADHDQDEVNWCLACMDILQLARVMAQRRVETTS